MLYVIILAYTVFTQRYCFHEALYYKASFTTITSYTFCISLVYLYYIAKYIVFNYFISGYLDGICH